MKILIDNGHGRATKGKCSPDRSFYEWQFNRQIAIALVERLKRLGYDAERIVTEDNVDISLSERCRRVNNHCRQLGVNNVIFLSIHANAAGGDGNWHTARGFSVFVAKCSSQRSKRLAQALYHEAAARGLQGNRCVPSCHYWQENFTVIARTDCPAVLTENLFYDNKEDLAILQSPEGKQKIVDLHVAGIVNFLNSL